MGNKVEEIEIKSVVEYITEVNKLLEKSEFNPNTHTAFFRGHANKDWKLEPGLLRNDGYIENEHLMYRTIIAQQTSEFSSCTSTLESLVKMQHYGLPTRLLDLTTNPLVALYFACEEIQANDKDKDKDKGKDKEGEVIVLKAPTESIKHYDSDTVSVLANIAKCKEEEIKINLNFDKWNSTDFSEEYLLKIEEEKEFNEYRESFNKLGQIQLLLHQISLEKSHFRSIINPCDLARVYIVNVKQDNQRIRNQMGSFVLFGFGISKENDSLMLSKKGATKILDDWNLNRSSRLIIDPNNKQKIIKELGLLGIRKSFIYPELEILAKEIGEQYKKQ